MREQVTFVNDATGVQAHVYATDTVYVVVAAKHGTCVGFWTFSTETEANEKAASLTGAIA